MIKNNNIRAFLDLLKVGLWENTESMGLEIHNEPVDWNKVYQMAGEQSVVGLILAGLETSTVKPQQELLLQWIGEVQMIEQTNEAMNQFIAKLLGKMREADIYTLLVKGQGVAQCYEKPFWRSSGDVDFLFSKDNYQKAIDFLLPLSSESKSGGEYSKEFAVTIQNWFVELHGTLRTCLSTRVDREVDKVQKDVFYGGNVRSWDNSGTTVFLPSPDNDVFFVFTHFIKHFYKEGMNLRQVCDWCRLLWTYKDSVNHELLESRILKAGLMNEWKAFASLAVDYIGMPKEAMPMYDSSSRWSKKAKKILYLVLIEYQQRVVKDTLAIAKIFPCNTIKFAPAIFFNINGLKIIERLFGL